MKQEFEGRAKKKKYVEEEEAMNFCLEFLSLTCDEGNVQQI